MVYHSHPLENEEINVIFAKGTICGHSTIPSTQKDFLENSMSFRTIHLLDECTECHVYTKHVDLTLSTDPKARHSHKGRDLYLEGVEVGRRLQLEEDSMVFSRYRGRLQAASRREQELLVVHERYRQKVDRLEKEIMDLGDRLMAMQMAYNDVAGIDHDSPRIVPLDHVATESDSFEEGPFNLGNDDFLLEQQRNLLDERDRYQDARFWKDTNALDSDSDSDGYETTSSESSILSTSSGDTTASDESDTEDKPDTLLAPPLETELSIGELTTLIEAAQEVDNTEALDQVRLLVQDAQRTTRHRRTAAQIFLLLAWRIPTWVSGPNPAPTPGARIPSTSASALKLPKVFVDASGWGIGLIINEQWLAWRFTAPLHPSVPVDTAGRIIMSWAELTALELGLLTLIAAGYRNARVVLHSDNSGVVDAVRAQKWVPHYGLDAGIKRIMGTCREAGLKVEVKWVSTKMNPADNPSRGVFPPPALVFEQAPTLPAHLEGVVQLVRAA